MEIPISGFIVESDDGNSRHSHKLFITSWDGQPIHVHEFEGITSIDVGHQHEYSGTTRPAPNGVEHTHEFHTVTTFNDGHTHEITGITGPVVPLPGGGHIHYFEGKTTVNGQTPHTHSYSGRTGYEINS